MHRAAKSCLRQIGFALSAVLSLCASAQPSETPATDAEYLYLKVTAAIAEGEISYAQQLLEKMMRMQPEHAGAWLDAAMLWCQLGEKQRAFDLWDEVQWRFHPPPGISEFIATQRRRGCSLQQKPFTQSVKFGTGYSNNINQGPHSLDLDILTPEGPSRVQLLPEAAPRSDTFTQIELHAQGPLLREWQVSAQAQLRRHDSSRNMDMQTLVAEISRPWNWQSWQGLVRYGLGGAFLAGSLYQRSLQLHLQMRLPLPRNLPWQAHISLTGSKVQHPSLHNFNADHWEITSWAERSFPHHGAWQGSLSTFYDAGAKLRPGGDRQGWASNIRWNYALPNWNSRPLLLRTGLSWQSADSKFIYAPGLIQEKRSQRTHSKYFSLTWVYDQKNSLTLEARSISNKENITVFSYRTHQLQLNALHNF